MGYHYEDLWFKRLKHGKFGGYQVEDLLSTPKDTALKESGVIQVNWCFWLSKAEEQMASAYTCILNPDLNRNVLGAFRQFIWPLFALAFCF